MTKGHLAALHLDPIPSLQPGTNTLRRVNCIAFEIQLLMKEGLFPTLSLKELRLMHLFHFTISALKAENSGRSKELTSSVILEGLARFCLLPEAKQGSHSSRASCKAPQTASAIEEIPIQCSTRPEPLLTSCYLSVIICKTKQEHLALLAVLQGPKQ